MRMILILLSSTTVLQSAICLIRLLLMQAKMVRLIEPKDRFDAIFLSEILLLNNRTVIEQRILDDITTVIIPIPIPISPRIVLLFSMFYIGAQQQLSNP